MSVDAEILKILSELEGTADEHESAAGSRGASMIHDPTSLEVFTAMRDAENTELKRQLAQLAPSQKSQKPSDIIQEDSPDRIQIMDVMEHSTIENQRIDIEVTSALMLGPVEEVESYDFEGSGSYGQAVAAAVGAVIPKEHVSADIPKLYHIPDGLHRRLYIYSDIPLLHNEKITEIAVSGCSAAMVVYWVAPGVARVIDNAALGLAVSMAKTLNLPIIAVSLEEKAVFETAQEVLHTLSQGGHNREECFDMGLKRKHMLRISSLVSLEDACRKIGVPLLSCCIDGAEMQAVDIFILLKAIVASSNDAQLIVITDYVRHGGHYESCLAVAAGKNITDSSAVKNRARRNCIECKDVKNSVLLVGVEHGDILSLMHSSVHNVHDVDEASIAISSTDLPSAKRQRTDDNVTESCPLSFEEFSMQFAEAATILIKNATAHHRGSFGVEFISNDGGQAICRKLCDEGSDINDKISLSTCSLTRWSALQRASQLYCGTAATQLERLESCPHSYSIWGKDPEEILSTALAAMRHMDVSLLRPEEEEAGISAESSMISACRAAWQYSDEKIDSYRKVSSLVRALIDMATAAGALSHRQLIREFFRLPQLNKNFESEKIMKQSYSIWNFVKYYIIADEYAHYCVSLNTAQSCGSPVELLISSVAQKVLSDMLSRTIEDYGTTIPGLRQYPEALFAANTPDSSFNSQQIALVYAGVTPSLTKGLSWLQLMMRSLPSPQMGFRTAVSELCLHSLHDESASEGHAIVDIVILLEIAATTTEKMRK